MSEEVTAFPESLYVMVDEDCFIAEMEEKACLPTGEGSQYVARYVLEQVVLVTRTINTKRRQVSNENLPI